jgi:predicted transcriptional regulator
MRIEIVESIEEKLKIDNNYVKDVLAGRVKIDRKRAEKTIVTTPEVFAKIFSPERMRLLLRIRKNDIKSIYQLAKNINRKYEAVFRDLKILEGFGIIKLRKKDRRNIPFMDEPVDIVGFAAS